MDKPDGVMLAAVELDQAVHRYMTASAEAFGEENPGIVIGWTLGIGITRFHDGGEEDALVIESNPGLNNYLARGLADATAECFQAQASGWGDDE